MMQTRRRLRCLFIGLLFSVFALVSISLPGAPATEPLVVFLVRHGEKVDAGQDPELSAAGLERAKQLGDALRDSGVKHIHSSKFIRTRNTARPAANRLGLDIKLYDATDLPALVSRLKTTGGRHLVVGHSTTTPKVVSLLGGKGGSPINELGEFDRLYVVMSDAKGKVNTVLLRYGNPFQPADR